MEIRDAMCWEQWQEPPSPRTERTVGREGPGSLGDLGSVSPARWLWRGLGAHPAASPRRGSAFSHLVQNQVVLPVTQRRAVRAHQLHKGHGEDPLALVLGWGDKRRVR